MLGGFPFSFIVIGWILFAGIAFTALRFFRAAYGRYVDESRAPLIPAALGWVLMESVSALGFAAYFLTSDRLTHLPSVAFFAMWQLHYIHRSFVYPVRARIRGKKMPISIVGLAVAFNTVNASLNGYWLFHLGPLREESWLADPRFVIGVVAFAVGIFINMSSDYRLVALRRQNGSDYKIPKGGLFRFVSCPNYFGEILEWCAWALATWSLAGLSFAVWTISNLAPRAITHHHWYRERFSEYPKERKALIPFII